MCGGATRAEQRHNLLLFLSGFVCRPQCPAQQSPVNPWGDLSKGFSATKVNSKGAAKSRRAPAELPLPIRITLEVHLSRE